MWTDEDIDAMARSRFSWFYPLFSDFPSQIYRADAARYMMLYLYGGVYIDMDMEVMKDFYPILEKDRVSIVGSPFPNVEKVQNSLMASPPHHPFWLEVLRDIAGAAVVMRDSVLDCTGPRMLDRVMEIHGRGIVVLPVDEFNPAPEGSIYNATRWRRDDPYTRHLYTATWRDRATLNPV
jgi:mannosyltransferase OCH1-like enzyme